MSASVPAEQAVSDQPCTNTIIFELRKQFIRRVDTATVASGSKNYLKARFETPLNDWCKPITAIFDSYTVLLDDNNECFIPWEALSAPHTMAVSAFSADLHTAIVTPVVIEPSGYISGETPEPPTPDVYQQLIDIAKNAENVANSVREDADAGNFNGAIGPIGPEGPAGQDAPQIDDNKASPDNPWSGSKIARELRDYAPITSAVTVTNTGRESIAISPTIPWHMQNLVIYGQVNQAGSPSVENPANITVAGASGSVVATISDGGSNNNRITFLTPNGLPGIRVSSEGNFVDQDGQMWLCDVVDYAAKIYTKNVGWGTFDPDKAEGFINEKNWHMTENALIKMIGYAPTMIRNDQALCNILVPQNMAYTPDEDEIYISEKGSAVAVTIRSSILPSPNIRGFRQFLQEHPMILVARRLHPETVPLTDDDIEAFYALQSYGGTTHVSIPGCGVSATALANPNGYIDNLIQRITALESAATNI